MKTCVIFLLLFGFMDTYGQTYSSVDLVGRWMICEMRKNDLEQASGCNSDLIIELMADSTCRMNENWYCNGERRNGSARWELRNDILTLQAYPECPGEPDVTMVIEWHNKDRFTLASQDDEGYILLLERLPSIGKSELQFGREKLVGQWIECIGWEKSNLITMDSTRECSDESWYHFYENGRYVWNEFPPNGDPLFDPVTGTWEFQDSRLILTEDPFDSTYQTSPVPYDVYWLNENQWVFVANETKYVLVYFYYTRATGKE
jgi:hypothetical protein